MIGCISTCCFRKKVKGDAFVYCEDCPKMTVIEKMPDDLNVSDGITSSPSGKVGSIPENEAAKYCLRASADSSSWWLTSKDDGRLFRLTPEIEAAVIVVPPHEIEDTELPRHRSRKRSGRPSSVEPTKNADGSCLATLLPHFTLIQKLYQIASSSAPI